MSNNSRLLDVLAPAARATIPISGFPRPIYNTSTPNLRNLLLRQAAYTLHHVSEPRKGHSYFRQQEHQPRSGYHQSNISSLTESGSGSKRQHFYNLEVSILLYPIRNPQGNTLTVDISCVWVGQSSRTVTLTCKPQGFTIIALALMAGSDILAQVRATD